MPGFYIQNDLTQIATNERLVSACVMDQALLDLKRDGYTNAHHVLQSICALGLGESYTMTDADMQALRVACACTEATAAVIKGLTRRVVTRA